LPASFARQSASFELSESVWTAGGHPAQGVVMSSASYRITLDALGTPGAAPTLTSASWSLDAGFVTAYAPPGEVEGLRFAAADTLVWDIESAAVHYNLYRGALTALSPADYGSCLSSPVTGTVAADADTPLGGDGFAYLVTATSRIDEEGTLGADSGGTARANTSPCP